jgi:plastocyanin
MRKLAWTMMLAGFASIALVACGGSSSSDTTAATTPTTTTQAAGGGGPTQSVKLSADPTNIAYTTKSLSAKTGNVAIDFNNPNSSLAHDVCVQTSSGQELGCTPQITGSSATLDLKNLKPGSYTFFCSVPGHEQAGMKGTLSVK